MSIFSHNGRAFKFRLVNLPNYVHREITKMILDNGGKLVNTHDRLVINFTMPEKYIPGKAMYDIQFIKDCVKLKEVRDLHEYKLGSKKEYDGCISSLFLHERPTCMYRYGYNPRPQNMVCSVCGSRNTFEIVEDNDTPGPSQISSHAEAVIKSESSNNSRTLEIHEIHDVAGPSKKSSDTSTLTKQGTSSTKDTESITSIQEKRVLRSPKVEPGTSYAESCSDSDEAQDAAKRKTDRLRIEQGDSDDDVSMASTSDLYISSDDSEVRPRIKVKNKNKNKNALRSSLRELDFKQEEDTRPVKENFNMEEWLVMTKRKAKRMEAPRKRNFSQWERWQMLIFLIENKLTDRAKGLDVWDLMIRRNDWGPRTKWSLNNHFLKYVLPSIEEFRLPKKIEKEFINLRNTK